MKTYLPALLSLIGLSLISSAAIAKRQAAIPAQPIAENATGVPNWALAILILTALAAFMYLWGWQDCKRNYEQHKSEEYGRWAEPK